MLSIVFLGIIFNVLSPLVRWQAQTGLAAVSSLPFAITILVQLYKIAIFYNNRMT